MTVAGTGKTTMPGQTIEFRGHLIDSLTLSKVTDLIQLMGGHYRLNDIRIGSLKKDISSTNMTIFAENEAKLKELLTTLSYYGAVPSGSVGAEVVSCVETGTIPDEAFTLKLPSRVFYEGQWLDLHAGESLSIVIDPATRQASLKKSGEIREGELLVSGTQGIEW